MATVEYQRDADGNVTNPPVIAEFEQRLKAAHLAHDEREIARIQREYDKARDAKVEYDESDEDERDEDDDDDEDWTN